MRIFAISDIHDDFETLEKALDFIKAENADLILLAGDYLLRTHSAKDKEECTSDGKLDRGALQKRILRNAGEKYKRLEELLDECGVPALMVPGNHDLRNYTDFFEGKDIHSQSKRLSEVVGKASIDDLVIAGYGGDGMVAVQSGNPLNFPCSEKDLYQHLNASNPDIVLLHSPPKKTVDSTIIPGKQPMRTYIGSLAARRHMVENADKARLIVCGHRHTPEIALYRSTAIVNTGNIGRFPTTPDYGLFAEVRLNQDCSVTEVTYYSAKENKVRELERIDLSGKD